MNHLPISERRCLYCNSIIYKGRSDKFHCSTRCKNARNYKENEAEAKRWRRLSARLLRNERILEHMPRLFAAADAIPFEALARENFDFSLFTASTVNQKTKRTVHWIFRFGWSYVGNMKYRIHERADGPSV